MWTMFGKRIVMKKYFLLSFCVQPTITGLSWFAYYTFTAKNSLKMLSLALFCIVVTYS